MIWDSTQSSFFFHFLFARWENANRARIYAHAGSGVKAFIFNVIHMG
jgi:hypothetical protein